SSTKRRRHWDRLYRGALGINLPEGPTPFAEWTLMQLEPGTRVVDLGCGNGRDTLHLATQGHSAIGLDFSTASFADARRKAAALGVPATYDAVNLYDFRSVVTYGAILAHGQRTPPSLYARFLLHTLEDDGRANLWSFCDMVLRGRGRAYFEFRTHRDRVLPHTYDGFRRYLHPDQVVAEIESAGGLVDERVEGQGLAAYGEEDPDVCRLVVTWQR
ncbi:MAG: methyltransferase domain-containing protein, partial [Propionibacteriales bacterium]|nr:methyltransferase domain-containing protein [Propionibacteriales bacterium]